MISVQMSFFSDGPAFPLTHEDVLALYHDYVFAGEKDSDAFTWSKIKTGYSYSIYGTKVFEHRPGDAKKARLVIENRVKSAANFSRDDLLSWLSELRAKKDELFRSLIEETFACCNDFKRCSAVGACIHQDDRFYNGCYYRTNLEAGRNFFREG